ncbi:MAG: tryptophan--tRNA ligase, partial [Burkholderiales bacterium]|nr:tryptophan--tRNA ligase [Burkholderiales bacterium]
AHPEEIEVLLQAGAAKARATAAPLLKKVRESLGLRAMQAIAAPAAKAEKKAALPLFKQFRLEDGLFYFNFSAADGRLLLQSTGFAQGKEAGQWIAKLKNEGVDAIEGAAISLSEGTTAADVSAALAVLLAE